MSAVKKPARKRKPKAVKAAKPAASFAPPPAEVMPGLLSRLRAAFPEAQSLKAAFSQDTGLLVVEGTVSRAYHPRLVSGCALTSGRDFAAVEADLTAALRTAISDALAPR